MLKKIFKQSKEVKLLHDEIDRLNQELVRVTAESDKTCLELRAKYAPAIGSGPKLEQKEKKELRVELFYAKKALEEEVKKAAYLNLELMNTRQELDKEIKKKSNDKTKSYWKGRSTLLMKKLSLAKEELAISKESNNAWRFSVNTILDQQKEYTNSLVKKIFDLEDENKSLKYDLDTKP